MEIYQPRYVCAVRTATSCVGVLLFAVITSLFYKLRQSESSRPVLRHSATCARLRAIVMTSCSTSSSMAWTAVGTLWVWRCCWWGDKTSRFWPRLGWPCGDPVELGGCWSHGKHCTILFPKKYKSCPLMFWSRFCRYCDYTGGRAYYVTWQGKIAKFCGRAYEFIFPITIGFYHGWVVLL